MQLPLVAPAPVVVEHAQVVRALFENRCQFQHFENYLTGLMVLENKSLANISRCVLASADKTNLSRFFSEAPWEQEQVNEKRIAYMLEQTAEVRRDNGQRIGTVAEYSLPREFHPRVHHESHNLDHPVYLADQGRCWIIARRASI
jgi:hypothetical protein